MQDSALWAEIEGYRFRPEDPANAPRGRGTRTSIAARLEDELNWAPGYIAEAIEEYRRFVYLSRITPDHLTPSQMIDQVWHAHMVDSRDYIENFCQRVLGGVLHHNPATGPDDAARHATQYQAARAAYLTEFAAEPPEDVWNYRDASQMAQDRRQTRHAKWSGTITGIGVAAICYLAFGWILAAIFWGFAAGAILTAFLSPRVPGPRYNRSDDSGGGGCSGCGD